MDTRVLKGGYDFDIDPENYKESQDDWIRNLAINGRDAGMTPDEIEYLIKRRINEMKEYELSNETPVSKKMDKPSETNGLTLNQTFWNNV